MSGMDRQTLRDWVIRLHEQRADVSSISRERRPSLTPDTRPFSPASLKEGPTPAIHGVARLRACDLVTLWF
jgi:hypothetical protein